MKIAAELDITPRIIVPAFGYNAAHYCADVWSLLEKQGFECIFWRLRDTVYTKVYQMLWQIDVFREV